MIPLLYQYILFLPIPFISISKYGVEPLLYILILWGVLSKNIPQYYHISTIKNRILWWKYFLSIHIIQSYLILPPDNYFISTAYFLSIINSNIFITKIVISFIKTIPLFYPIIILFQCFLFFSIVRYSHHWFCFLHLLI